MVFQYKPMFFCLCLCACFLGVTVWSGTAGEYRALEGVHGVKTMIDFRDGVPESAAVHLQLAHDTFLDKTLRKAAAAPDFVVVFMGPSVKLLSSKREAFTPPQRQSLEKIDKVISAMAKDGIRLEICQFAVKFFGVDPKTVAPELNPVDNGWISEIGYQAKGYSVVPAY